MHAATIDVTPGSNLRLSANSVLDHPRTQTARLSGDPKWNQKTKTLPGTVSVENNANLKLPSGVSLRCAFIARELRDQARSLWTSGLEPQRRRRRDHRPD